MPRTPVIPGGNGPTGRGGRGIRVRVVFHGHVPETPGIGASATTRLAGRCSRNPAKWGIRERGRRRRGYRFVAMRPALSRLWTRSQAARTVSWVCTGNRRWFRETELPENIAGSRENAPTGRDGERIRCQGVFRPTPPKVPSDGTPNSSVRCAGAPGERSHGSWNSPWRQAQTHGAPGVECVSRRSSRLDASTSGGRSCPGPVAGANGVMGAYRESTLVPTVEGLQRTRRVERKRLYGTWDVGTLRRGMLQCRARRVGR